MQGSPRTRARFGTFEVELDSGEVFRSGTRLHIQDKPFEILVALLARPGELVTRQELRERLWPDEDFLEFDDNLNTAISKLRQVLGDSASSPRFVETVPRRGYRFLAPVVWLPVSRDSEDPDALPQGGEESLERPLGGEGSLGDRLRSLMRAGAVVASAAVVAGSVAAVVLLRERPAPRISLGETVPLTATPGLEEGPSYSPDGTRIVFASDRLGNMDVWVRQLAAGPEVVLTAGHQGYDGGPVWSPTGEWIAFASEREGGGIFVMTALGGSPRRIAELPFAPSIELAGSAPTLSWSPTGERLAYAHGLKDQAGLFLVEVDGEGAAPVRLPVGLAAYTFVDPAFSPDGEWLAFAELSGSGSTVGRIWVVDVESGAARPVTSGEHADRQPEWGADGGRLFFLSDRGGSNDVWWVALDRHRRPLHEARPLTVGAGVASLAVAPDGGSIVYSKVVERSSIQIVDLAMLASSGLAASRPLFAENHLIEHFDLSPDSGLLAFDSNRTGNADLWILQRSSGELRQVTSGPEHDWHPSFTADGHGLVFHSLRDGQRDLYTTTVAGDPPRILAPDPHKDWVPACSPTRDLVAFVSDRSGNPDVWIVSANGGLPRRLTVHRGNDHNPLFTPDGEEVVFSSNRTGTDELYRIPVGGGEPRRLTDQGWLDVIAFAWLPDEDVLFAWGRKAGGESPARFWSVRLADGSARPLGGLDLGSRQPAPAMAADDQSLYFLLWEREGDLWRAQLLEED